MSGRASIEVSFLGGDARRANVAQHAGTRVVQERQRLAAEILLESLIEQGVTGRR